MTHFHHTAPSQYVEASGIGFAYLRFGKPGVVPPVLNLHFTGAIDHWDPLVADGLAANHGDASYFRIPASGERAVSAIWTYETLFGAMAEIRDYVAVYADRVDSIGT